MHSEKFFVVRDSKNCLKHNESYLDILMEMDKIKKEKMKIAMGGFRRHLQWQAWKCGDPVPRSPKNL